MSARRLIAGLRARIGRSHGRAAVRIALAALVAALLVATAAFGYWTSTDSSNGHAAEAAADSLPQGATPGTPATTPSTNSNTVRLSFAQASTATGGVAIPASNYSLKRYPAAGGSGVAVTASCSGTGTITCTESNVPDGLWEYTDTPTYGSNWVGAESAPSASVTVDTTPPSVSVAYPANGATYGANWSGVISGTASDATSGVASTAVAIEDTNTGLWFNGTGFSSSTKIFNPASGTTTWSYSLSVGLTSGHSYAVIGQATDNAGNVGTSSTVTFTYSNTPPSDAVTYPTNGTTYDGNWTGSITGTASPNAGAGTSVSSTAVAIEDSNTGQWFNGTSFSSSTKVFNAATGGSSWSYALAANLLTTGHSYAVIGQATDSLGNTGTSSTVTFTYNTTHPSVAVTYPATNTTYGTNWSGTISGTASSNAGAGTSIASTAVTIENTSSGKWWNGTSFSAGSQTFVAATGTSSWTYALAASNLVSGDTYTVVGQATDSAGNVGTSPTTTFTYNTTAPTVAVTYPVNGTTYDGNWTGTLTGTASSNAGSGTSISSSSVAIENTTTGLWWNGTSFGAGSQTFQTATGTSSWTYGLAATNLTTGDNYSVVARATDSAGNVGTSSAVSFTYNTTHPTVAVTFPVAGTAYNSGTWSGSITGTASSNAGAGTSITSAAVSIENTTTNEYWNGSSFSSSSQMFNTASGTSSWSYGLAATNLISGDSYQVVAQATDSAGNVGTSGTLSFTYSSVSVNSVAEATNSSTTGGITTVGGDTYLIAVYCYGGTAACSSQKATVDIGSNTPFSSQTNLLGIQTGSAGGKDCIELIEATGIGNATAEPVTVNAGQSAGTVGFVNVLHVSTGATVKVVPPTGNTGSSNSATALLSPPNYAEVAVVGVTDGTGTTTVSSTPSGVTRLGSFEQSTTPFGADMGVYFDPTAQSSLAFGLSASEPWGTIAVEVG